MQSIRINVVKLSTKFYCMEITDDLDNNFLFPEVCSREWEEEGKNIFFLKKKTKMHLFLAKVQVNRIKNSE